MVNLFIQFMYQNDDNVKLSTRANDRIGRLDHTLHNVCCKRHFCWWKLDGSSGSICGQENNIKMQFADPAVRTFFDDRDPGCTRRDLAERTNCVKAPAWQR